MGKKGDQALALLATPGAPRVMSPASLAAWLLDLPGENAFRWSPPAIASALGRWQDLGLVERVAHGVYLNLRATPRPRPAEAAPWIREGAVVSLQYVLGLSGVLNNPTEVVTCVISRSASRAVGVVGVQPYEFRFNGLRDDLIPDIASDWARDAYAANAFVPTATPEKALLDWIYLASASPLWHRPPLHDLDIEALDTERLARLASRMGLTDRLAIALQPPQRRTHQDARRHP